MTVAATAAVHDDLDLYAEARRSDCLPRCLEGTNDRLHQIDARDAGEIFHQGGKIGQHCYS